MQFFETHKSALVAKRRRSVEKDEFGRTFTDRWRTTLRELFDDMILPDLLIKNSQNRENKIDILDRLIEDACDESAADNNIEVMTGGEYENVCAQYFEYAGATVVRTPSSGDDGADLIVTTATPKRIAVQCKCQSSPVGNKAVQEVTASLKMHEANEGVVVSASGYTKSAIRTAEAHNVTLLHHDDIPSFVEDNS